MPIQIVEAPDYLMEAPRDATGHFDQALIDAFREYPISRVMFHADSITSIHGLGDYSLPVSSLKMMDEPQLLTMFGRHYSNVRDYLSSFHNYTPAPGTINTQQVYMERSEPMDATTAATIMRRSRGITQSLAPIFGHWRNMGLERSRDLATSHLDSPVLIRDLEDGIASTAARYGAVIPPEPALLRALAFAVLHVALPAHVQHRMDYTQLEEDTSYLRSDLDRQRASNATLSQANTRLTSQQEQVTRVQEAVEKFKTAPDEKAKHAAFMNLMSMVDSTQSVS